MRRLDQMDSTDLAILSAIACLGEENNPSGKVIADKVAMKLDLPETVKRLKFLKFHHLIVERKFHLRNKNGKLIVIRRYNITTKGRIGLMRYERLKEKRRLSG